MMRFGIFSVVDHYPTEIERSTARFYAELLEQAQLADELGYQSFWVAEHHFHEYGVLPRPAILLASVAAKTKKIRLGSAVTVLPFDNPIRVAEDYAILDLISGGRLEFGVGSGYLEHEFEGFSLDPKERRALFDESLEIICQAWRGGKFSHAGAHFKFDSVALNVLPLQVPSPPIFIAVLRNEVAPYVGRQNKGMMMIPYARTESLSELESACSAYKKEFALASNSDTQVCRIPFGLHTFCSRNTEQARQFVRPFMDRYVRTRLYARKSNLEELIAKDLAAIGDPKEIIRIARLYESAGFSEFLMIMNFGALPHESVLESMRLIAAEVFPSFAAASQPGLRV